jgi:hypothetical protein
MTKRQPTDAYETQEQCIELFVLDADIHGIKATHIDDMTTAIAGLTRNDAPEDFPLDHFGDHMTPSTIAEAIKAWADRQVEQEEKEQAELDALFESATDDKIELE